MCKKNLKFEQLFDVRAIRIIVDSVEKCYETLSLIQESFEVLSKEFDDYIAKPKPNGYQSLHTVIVGSRVNRSRSRSEPARCTSSQNSVWPRIGAIKKAPNARPANMKKIVWLGCARCWLGRVTFKLLRPRKLRKTNISTF